MEENSLSRTELLIGNESIEKIKKSKVAVIGVGGVGSFALEAIARAGVGEIIIADEDVVSISNINRQLHATTKTIGKAKTSIMEERVRDINPLCKVKSYKVFVSEENIKDIILLDIDYVIDAIDTVSSKIALIMYCKENNIKIISCLGTGNKLDPTRFKITDIYSTSICPLAKVMRHELRKRGIRDLKVLYSDEEPIKPMGNEITSDFKRQVPGSISFVPPVAGLIIAGQVIKELLQK